MCPSIINNVSLSSQPLTVDAKTVCDTCSVPMFSAVILMTDKDNKKRHFPQHQILEMKYTKNRPTLTPFLCPGSVTLLAASRAGVSVPATVTMIWTARTGTPAGLATAEIPAEGPVVITPTVW